jgi:hypothetical protein
VKKLGLPSLVGNCAHSVNYHSISLRTPALDPFTKPHQHSRKRVTGWLKKWGCLGKEFR